MIDVILLIGRLLFVALLYLFLFAIMKTGIGLVRGQRKGEKTWTVAIEKGPKELRGVNIAVNGPVIVGRSQDPISSSVPNTYLRAMRALCSWARTSSWRI